MSSRNCQRELEAVATALGFVLHRSSKHLIWRHPSGAQVVCPKSPSDHRTIRNFERDCKRAFNTIHFAH